MLVDQLCWIGIGMIQGAIVNIDGRVQRLTATNATTVRAQRRIDEVGRSETSHALHLLGDAQGGGWQRLQVFDCPRRLHQGRRRQPPAQFRQPVQAPLHR